MNLAYVPFMYISEQKWEVQMRTCVSQQICWIHCFILYSMQVLNYYEYEVHVKFTLCDLEF